MSSEKLASEELAQWRVQTIKKDLDKIKEREEEAMSQGATIRKKTYKGDVEIETTEKADIIEVCIQGIGRKRFTTVLSCISLDN